jgi:hypothetical protein
MSGMILRLGLGAEELAWAAIFILAPISGVYYPIAVLPSWLQSVAWAIPSAHVFEGMRGAGDGVFRWDHFRAQWRERRLPRARRRVSPGRAQRHNRGTLLQMGSSARAATRAAAGGKAPQWTTDRHRN